MPDASPTKWHLAHVTWFVESFILRDHVPGYRVYDANFAYLFNSYYEAEGARHSRNHRGMITRPSLAQIIQYRAHVDMALDLAFASLPASALILVELAIQHEQQHQELLLTDILHLFSLNPLYPAYVQSNPIPLVRTAAPLSWLAGKSGLQNIGHNSEDFAFDCEGPQHQIFLQPFMLADRCVTNGEWMQFITGGGYANPSHWLSDGWAWVQRERIMAPLYWAEDGRVFGLNGMHEIDQAAPVTHISLYEADAYASWAGYRLPTEMEWEVMAHDHDPRSGIQLDAVDNVRPLAAGNNGLFGNVWQWTGSVYRPYPGFRAAKGAVGEYNGKFMSGQFVLRGGSCATPRGHVRASYRNFFYPHHRWQFTGLRLAKDV